MEYTRIEPFLQGGREGAIAAGLRQSGILVYGLRLLHCFLTQPNAGLEDPALGGHVREATWRRLPTMAASGGSPDFATVVVYGPLGIDSILPSRYNWALVCSKGVLKRDC